MANIPKQYTQEAEDGRAMDKKLENPKSRWLYGLSAKAKENFDGIKWGLNETKSK